MVPRLILLGALIFAIFVISGRSTRTWNFELPEVSELDELEAVGGTSGSPLAHRSGGFEQRDNSVMHQPKESVTTEPPTETSLLTTGTPSTVTESTPALDARVEEPATETTVGAILLDAESIYRDMVELEWVMRKYLSGGHKISMMNFGTIKEYGYLPPEQYALAERYRIGFRPSGDGYDLWIEPAFELSDELRGSLLRKQKVRLMDGKIRYVFWIRAYR